MYLKIGENIKKYRRERELSQEMLAERLGVSFQAVSKWERNETYPDITMLPAIANFFGVSVDALLGTQEIYEKEEVEKIIYKCHELNTHYEFEEIIDEIEAGLKLFPNNFELLSWYAYAIQNSDPQKSIETSEYILANCTDSEIRNWVQSTICHAYFKSGKKEKAIESASLLPNYYNTSEDCLRNFLDGDALKKHIQDEIIIKLAYEFWYAVRKLRKLYSPNEQIMLYRKSNEIYDAIYETDDVPFKLSRKMMNYMMMAEVCLENDMVKDAFGYMRSAVECALTHDRLPRIVESKALLFNCHAYDRNWESKADLKLCDELLHDFESEDKPYKDIRDSDEYAEIINMLKE